MNKKLPIIGLISVFALSIALQLSQNVPAPSTSSKDLFQSKSGIAIIDIYGPIAFASPSQSFIPTGADAIINQLKAAEENKKVKGIILRINSPGGTVGASQEVFSAIQSLKTKRDIPIVASIADVGASGAYYAAMASDTIYANRGSLIGSIGVIMGNINITELAKRYGVSYEVYKSGDYKDSFSSWRTASEKEKELYQGLIDNVYSQFLTDFVSSRKLTEKQAKNLAQGQVFTGETAKEKGIIDELGTFQDALAFTAQKAGIQGKPTIIHLEDQPFKDVLSLWRDQLGATLRNTLVPSTTLEYR